MGNSVTYISDVEIAALPEEAEQRFVSLESIVRERYENAYNDLGNNESPLPLLRRYMSIVLPAAKHYGIKDLSSWDQPSISADCDVYQAFLADVDYCITALR